MTIGPVELFELATLLRRDGLCVIGIHDAETFNEGSRHPIQGYAWFVECSVSGDPRKVCAGESVTLFGLKTCLRPSGTWEEIS